MASDVPPLRVVELLFRSKSQVSDLSHVVNLVSLFLDSSLELPLHKACKLNSLELLNRIWTSSSLLLTQSKTSPKPFWSLRGLIRCDSKYRQYQFSLSLTQAIIHQNLDVIKWLSTKLPGKTVRAEAVNLAAKLGSMPFLQFFLDTDNMVIAERLRNQSSSNVGLCVKWGSQLLASAVSSRRNDVVWWVIRHLHRIRFDMAEALDVAVVRGDILMVEWLLDRGSEWPTRRVGRNPAHDVAAEGRLDVLQWVAEQSQLNGIVGLVLVAAENGHLDIVRWLIDRDAQNGAKNHLTDLGEEAGLAIHTAIANGHLSVAKYLRVRARLPKTKVECALQAEEHLIHIEIFSRQLGTRNRAAAVSWKTMVDASGCGHLDCVKWLYEEYGSGWEVNLFLPEKKAPTDVYAMDAAASNGHLEVLQFLHGLQFSLRSESKKRKRGEIVYTPSPICTKAAMNGAAANGFIDVVKWLHQNRSEGCSVEAMNGAAAGGHLDVVQWLRDNRSEGCTTAAMDGACQNGHLAVVQWLHSNTSADRYANAMNLAAANGHLDFVKWLHGHRTEGCTVAAMNGAAEHGHLDVVKWLHNNRTEGCTPSAMDTAAREGHLNVVKWLHDHLSEGCTSVAIEGAAARSHFEVFLFVHYQCLQKCTSQTVELAKNGKTPDVYKWILRHYPAYRNPPRGQ